MPDLHSSINNPELFPVLSHCDFFNHAGVCPLPRPAADAFRKYAAESERSAYLNNSWYTDVERLRILAASIINAQRDEIAFIKNTSEGISIVASGLDWQWGDRIVTTAVEYPANIYPWMEVARSHGVKLVMVPEETAPDGSRQVPLDKILKEAADPRTRLVSLSHVEFASGQRHDIATIGAFCRQNKKLFNVDAIQSVGVLPVDVKAMNIDYLSADGHKWMLGPEGAGIFYCRRELLDRTRPLMIGWMNVINPEQYGQYDYTLKPDAGRFESGTYNVPGLLSLKASLELLSTIGIDRIAQRIQHLTQHLADRLPLRGYKVLSPRTNNDWSGILSFQSPTHDHSEIIRTLRKSHKTEIALREGRLRVSPHFYNTEEQLDRLLANLPPHDART
ncbi:MAG TPA: aminotransferase class V-fold PLP-dependent enzyme [Tepidisphaeraceae bacterium]|jgi:selenocysteine lyase/cysteine desulfurase